MIRKATLLLAAASLLSVGGVVFAPSAALAYTTQADCESYEGAGACASCGGGWHRKFACADVMANPALKASKLKALNTQETSKLASTRAKALPSAKLPNK